MTPIDHEVIIILRDMWLENLSASELLRFLDSKGMHPIEMIEYFRAAFSLDFGDARYISGWFADGTGELDDIQIHQLLAPVINENRSKWA